MDEKTNGEVSQDREVVPRVCLTPKLVLLLSTLQPLRELGEGRGGESALPEAFHSANSKTYYVPGTLQGTRHAMRRKWSS